MLRKQNILMGYVPCCQLNMFYGLYADWFLHKSNLKTKEKIKMLEPKTIVNLKKIYIELGNNCIKQ